MFFYIWLFAVLLSLFSIIFSNNLKFSVNNKDVTKNIYSLSEFAIIFFTFILLVCNREHIDIVRYKKHYEAFSQFSDREVLYNFLRVLFYSLGYNFFQYRNLLILVSGCCAIIGIKKAGILPSNVIFFYLISVLFTDSFQLRNCICLYFLILAIHLLQYEKFFSCILYIIVIFLLCLIHSAFAFYYFFLITYIRNVKIKKNVICSIIFFVTFLIILTFFNGHKVPFAEFFLSLVLNENDNRLTNYLTTGRFGFLYLTIVQILIIVFMKIIFSKFYFYNSKEKLVRVIIEIQEYSLLIIPFLMMNMEFYRILRNSFVISIIGFMIMYNSCYKNKKILIFLVILLITLLWSIFELFIFSDFHYRVDYIFKYGVLFYN